MPVIYSPKRRFSEIKAKDLFKVALEKRPQSIHSLRQSIATSNFKYDNFVNILKRSSDIFHTSCKQDTDDAEHQQFNRQARAGKRGKQAHFFKKAKWKQHKNMQKQLILQNHREQLLQPSCVIENAKNGTSNNIMVRQNKLLALQVNTSTKNDKPLQEQRRTANLSSEEKLQKANRFWRKIEAGHGSHHRWKTEEDERTGENTLGDITKYSKRKECKAVNFLIFQIQVGINDTKRTRKSAGLD